MVSIEYLAGFTDGEGYLAIGRIPRRRASHEYPVRMVVYNTSRALLEDIKRTWGGTLSSSQRRKPSWRAQHALIWTNEAAADLVARLAPYLRIKRRQAAALLRFQEHVRLCRRTRDAEGHLLPLTAQEVGFRESYHTYLKRLNARGPPSPSSLPPELPGGETPPPLMPTGPVSLEYLAGFIDAEGSLMIARARSSDPLRPLYLARMTVTNTDKAILEQVQETFGGILSDNRRPHPGWKQGFQLIWTGGTLDRFLPSLVPWLRLKREQAQLLVDFIQDVKTTPRSRKGPNGRFFAPLPEEVHARREQFYLRIRALNAKGVALRASRPYPTSSGESARENTSSGFAPVFSSPLGRQSATEA